MITALLMAQAIVSSTRQTGGITTGSVGTVYDGALWCSTSTPDPTKRCTAAVVVTSSMGCGRNDPNANIEVCIRDDGRRLLRFEFPPCGTPEAAAATHCLEWEIMKPDGSPLWHYKPTR